MNVIEVSGLAKAFGSSQAVADVSFEVGQGEIFGLLGPNGAGKTTTIRLILDIFRPDRGSISVLGGPMNEAKKDRIGYKPEERGLYQDVALERCLLYLASLKGVPAAQARPRLDGYLDRFELALHKTKKVKELSKGMQQKAQIIATLLHGPELVIIDEPFTSLDPINTRAVKDPIRDLQEAGTTIVMSTHQMHQVEQLCDRILLINKGRNLLYDPHGGLAATLSLLPLTSILTVAIRNVLVVVPAWQVAISGAVQLGLALGAIWLAARAFRIGNLRYGQRLRLRELVVGPVAEAAG